MEAAINKTYISNTVRFTLCVHYNSLTMWYNFAVCIDFRRRTPCRPLSRPFANEVKTHTYKTTNVHNT